MMSEDFLLKLTVKVIRKTVKRVRSMVWPSFMSKLADSELISLSEIQISTYGVEISN